MKFKFTIILLAFTSLSLFAQQTQKQEGKTTTTPKKVVSKSKKYVAKTSPKVSSVSSVKKTIVTSPVVNAKHTIPPNPVNTPASNPTGQTTNGVPKANPPVNTNPTGSRPANTQTVNVQSFHWDEFFISGGVGAGANLSSNIVGSGAVLPTRTELTWQLRHRRLGFGFANELQLSLQSLYGLAIGNKPGIHKLYFIYEKYLFRNFPINLGFSSHLGFFTFNNPTNNAALKDTTKSGSLGMFGNVGVALEMGIRPVYLFVRPDIEYQSYSGFHKQIQATVNVGIKLKFLSQEEKDRRSAKREARKRRRN